MKITEKVAFNIASEASYVYILSGQNLIKNGQFWRVFKNLNSVTRHVTFNSIIFNELLSTQNIKVARYARNTK